MTNLFYFFRGIWRCFKEPFKGLINAMIEEGKKES
jgi:hypothetical protein